MEHPLPGSPAQKSVLFVCLGNICRSPTGEGLFQQLVESRNLASQFIVDSAGTAGYHIGKLPDPRMREAAQRRGLELTSRSRKITRSDLEIFDLVIAMDSENFRDIQSLHEEPAAAIKMLSDFLGDEWPTQVPDPYFGGEAGFGS